MTRKFKPRGGRADASVMRWKMLVGILLVVLGGAGLVRDFSQFDGGYGAGRLVGGLVFLLLGILLVRADVGPRAR
jgi:uncharacterized membrane protein